MSERAFRCYAAGSHGDWEAICVDLDISVQGGSFREVIDIMGEAISTYIDDVAAESPETAQRLLGAASPMALRPIA